MLFQLALPTMYLLAKHSWRCTRIATLSKMNKGVGSQ